MALEELHSDRARARSFGSVAEQYDRYRPAYPDALMDDLAALRPAQVLDVASGTGKVAVALTRRGLSVLGVEVDERMAAVARGHGIPVEIAAFETWDDAGRQFDLVTCGAAWHWIDPVLGVSKAAKVMRPGGTIARFWNYYVLPEPVISAFDAVYREYAPDAIVHGRPLRKETTTDPFEQDAAFSSVEIRTYGWERTLTADEWVGMAATFSDHQRMEPERLIALQQALHETIENLGGTVQATCETYVLSARRA